MKFLRRSLPLLILTVAFFFQNSLASAQPRSPQDVVNLFMEVYGTERMREILPYTLPAFRDGLEPEVWLERDYRRVLVRKGVLTYEEVLEEVKAVRRELEGKRGR